METLGYYNGVINDLEHSTIPMLDRACYFGDGVFNVAYSRNYIVYAINDHIAQFFESAEKLRIKLDFSKQDLIDLIYKLIKKMDSGDLWIYFQASRGTDYRVHSFLPKDTKPNLLIMIKPASIRDIHQKVRCITTEDNRHELCNIKTLNYVANVLAAQKAIDYRVDESIFVRNGIVTECVHSNIGILKNGKLITHPKTKHIYAGVGRKHTLEMCKNLGIEVEERPFDVEEMMRADEVFKMSGSSFCLQIVKINNKKVGGKDTKTLSKLQEALLERFLNETNNAKHYLKMIDWNEYVKG